MASVWSLESYEYISTVQLFRPRLGAGILASSATVGHERCLLSFARQGSPTVDFLHLQRQLDHPGSSTLCGRLQAKGLTAASTAVCLASHSLLPLLAVGSSDGCVTVATGAFMQDPSELQLGLGAGAQAAGARDQGAGADVLMVAAVDPSVTLDQSGAVSLDAGLAGRKGIPQGRGARAGSSTPSPRVPMPTTWAASPVTCVAFHPTLPLLAAGNKDGHVALWRVGVEDPQHCLVGGTHLQSALVPRGEGARARSLRAMLRRSGWAANVGLGVYAGALSFDGGSPVLRVRLQSPGQMTPPLWVDLFTGHPAAPLIGCTAGVVQQGVARAVQLDAAAGLRAGGLSRQAADGLAALSTALLPPPGLLGAGGAPWLLSSGEGAAAGMVAGGATLQLGGAWVGSNLALGVSSPLPAGSYVVGGEGALSFAWGASAWAREQLQLQMAGLGMSVGGDGASSGGLAAMIALEASGGKATPDAAGGSDAGSKEDDTPESAAANALGRDLEDATTLARLFGSGLVGRCALTSGTVYVSSEQRLTPDPGAHKIRYCLRRRDLLPQPRASDEKGEALLPVTSGTEGEVLAWLPHVCPRSGMPMEPCGVALGEDGRYAIVKYRLIISPGRLHSGGSGRRRPLAPPSAVARAIAAARSGGGSRTAEGLRHRGSSRTSGLSAEGVRIRGEPGSSIGVDGSESWVKLQRTLGRTGTGAVAKPDDGEDDEPGNSPYVIVGPLWSSLPVVASSNNGSEDALAKLAALGVLPSSSDAGRGSDLPRWVLPGSPRGSVTGDRHCTVDRFGRRVAIRIASAPKVSAVRYATSVAVTGGGAWLASTSATDGRDGEGTGLVECIRLPDSSGLRATASARLTAGVAASGKSAGVAGGPGDEGDLPPLAFGDDDGGSGAQESKAADDFDPFGGGKAGGGGDQPVGKGASPPQKAGMRNEKSQPASEAGAVSEKQELSGQLQLVDETVVKGVNLCISGRPLEVFESPFARPGVGEGSAVPGVVDDRPVLLVLSELETSKSNGAMGRLGSAVAPPSLILQYDVSAFSESSEGAISVAKGLPSWSLQPGEAVVSVQWQGRDRSRSTIGADRSGLHSTLLQAVSRCEPLLAVITTSRVAVLSPALVPLAEVPVVFPVAGSLSLHDACDSCDRNAMAGLVSGFSGRQRAAPGLCCRQATVSAGSQTLDEPQLRSSIIEEGRQSEADVALGSADPADGTVVVRQMSHHPATSGHKVGSGSAKANRGPAGISLASVVSVHWMGACLVLLTSNGCLFGLTPLGRVLRLATLPEGLHGHVTITQLLPDRAILVARSASSGVSFTVTRPWSPGSGLVTAACDLALLLSDLHLSAAGGASSHLPVVLLCRLRQSLAWAQTQVASTRSQAFPQVPVSMGGAARALLQDRLESATKSGGQSGAVGVVALFEQVQLAQDAALRYYHAARLPPAYTERSEKDKASDRASASFYDRLHPLSQTEGVLPAFGASPVAAAALERAGMVAVAAWTTVAGLGSPLGHIRSGPRQRFLLQDGKEIHSTQQQPIPTQLGVPVLGATDGEDSDDDGIAEAVGGASNPETLVSMHAKDGTGRGLPGTETAQLGVSHSVEATSRIPLVVAAAVAIRRGRAGDAAVLLLRRRPQLLSYMCRRATALWVTARLSGAQHQPPQHSDVDAIDSADPSAWQTGYDEAAHCLRSLASRASSAAGTVAAEALSSYEVALAAACGSAARALSAVAEDGSSGLQDRQEGALGLAIDALGKLASQHRSSGLQVSAAAMGAQAVLKAVSSALQTPGSDSAKSFLKAMEGSGGKASSSGWQGAMGDALEKAARLPTFAAPVQRPNLLLLQGEDGEEDEGEAGGASDGGQGDSALWKRLRPHLPSVAPGEEAASVAALADAWESPSLSMLLAADAGRASAGAEVAEAADREELQAFFPQHALGAFSSASTPKPFAPQPLPTGLRPLAITTLQQGYGTVHSVAAGGLTKSQASAVLSGQRGTAAPAEEEDAETKEVRQLMARLGIGSAAKSAGADSSGGATKDENAWSPAELPALGHGKEDKVTLYLRFGATRVAGTSAAGKAGNQVGLASLGGAATAGPNDGLRLRGEDDLVAEDLSQFAGRAYYVRHRAKDRDEAMEEGQVWCRPDAGVYASQTVVTPFNPGDPDKVVMPRGLISNFHASAVDPASEDEGAPAAATGAANAGQAASAVGKIPFYDSLTESEDEDGMESEEEDETAAAAKAARKAKRRKALAAKRDKQALRARKAASKELLLARRAVRRLLAWLPRGAAPVGAVFPVRLGSHTDIGVRPWCRASCTWSIEAWVLLGFERDLSAMLEGDDDGDDDDDGGFGGGDGMGFGDGEFGGDGGGEASGGGDGEDDGGIGKEVVLLRRLEPTPESMQKGKQLLEQQKQSTGAAAASAPASGAGAGGGSRALEVESDPKKALKSIHPKMITAWELFVSPKGKIGFRCRRPAIPGATPGPSKRRRDRVKAAKEDSGAAEAADLEPFVTVLGDGKTSRDPSLPAAARPDEEPLETGSVPAGGWVHVAVVFDATPQSTEGGGSEQGGAGSSFNAGEGRVSLYVDFKESGRGSLRCGQSLGTPDWAVRAKHLLDHGTGAASETGGLGRGRRGDAAAGGGGGGAKGGKAAASKEAKQQQALRAAAGLAQGMSGGALVMAPAFTGALAEVRVWGTRRSRSELHDERSHPLGLADVTKKSLQVEISAGGGGGSGQAASGAGVDGVGVLGPPPGQGSVGAGVGSDGATEEEGSGFGLGTPLPPAGGGHSRRRSVAASAGGGGGGSPLGGAGRKARASSQGAGLEGVRLGELGRGLGAPPPPASARGSGGRGGGRRRTMATIPESFSKGASGAAGGEKQREGGGAESSERNGGGDRSAMQEATGIVEVDDEEEDEGDEVESSHADASDDDTSDAPGPDEDAADGGGLGLGLGLGAPPPPAHERGGSAGSSRRGSSRK